MFFLYHKVKCARPEKRAHFKLFQRPTALDRYRARNLSSPVQNEIPPKEFPDAMSHLIYYWQLYYNDIFNITAPSNKAQWTPECCTNGYYPWSTSCDNIWKTKIWNSWTDLISQFSFTSCVLLNYYALMSMNVTNVNLHRLQFYDPITIR